MKTKALRPNEIPPKPFCYDIEKYLADPIHHFPRPIEDYDGKFLNTFNQHLPEA